MKIIEKTCNATVGEDEKGNPAIIVLDTIRIRDLEEVPYGTEILTLAKSIAQQNINRQALQLKIHGKGSKFQTTIKVLTK